jgi:23S rRNA pseudouridine2457 synthase
MTTLVFYKPYGVLSKFTGKDDQITLRQYIPVPGVYAAGRLDKDSEGMLILTDEGDLVRQITSPRAKQPKIYLAQVEGIASEAQIQPMRHGLAIQDYQTLPAEVEIIPSPDLPARPVPVRNYHPTTWLRIILQEGKNRQVRRMTAAVGLPTLRLVRIAIGNIELGNLRPGEWRFASPEELRGLTGSGAGNQLLANDADIRHDGNIQEA